jgi:hypothetical protein
MMAVVLARAFPNDPPGASLTITTALKNLRITASLMRL